MAIFMVWLRILKDLYTSVFIELLKKIMPDTKSIKLLGKSVSFGGHWCLSKLLAKNMIDLKEL